MSQHQFRESKGADHTVSKPDQKAETRLVIVGFGEVGKSLARLIESDIDAEVVGVADSTSAIRDEEGLNVREIIERKRDDNRVGDGDSAENLLREAEYDVLVEVSTTSLDSKEALSHAETALERGADVVTSNKRIAIKYDKLEKKASEKGVELCVGGAVGGALPVVSTLESLQGYEVERIRGVLNGTTNFVLSQMSRGYSYEEALKEAQERGIAESNPSLDVEGVDTALKCVALSNVVFDSNLGVEDADVEGITELTNELVENTSESGYSIRLVGEVTPNCITVEPRFVPMGDDFDVEGPMNVISFETEVGEITLKGRGAGGEETARCLLNDLSQIV